MPISTSKLTTLGQLKLQAERIKQELASYVLASSLGSLATKSEISETELSEALKAVINGKMDATSSMTTQQINQAISQAIASSQHAKFEKVETVPTTETAEENVLYLVMNSETEFYDIYALVSGEVVRLDDTSVDLSAVGGSLYEGTKDSLETSDTSVIEAYFEENSATTPKKGDVFVITTVISGVEYEQSAYYYDGDSWVAMTGNVDADKVIMREDITMAGNYTQVGNLTKGQNATGTLASKGKSISEVLTEILSKRLQPTITAQPSISGFALSGAKAVEAGTKLASVNYTAGTLNPGSYQYGPETGVTATNWVVQRITDGGTEQIASVDAASLAAGSDDNGGAGFQIGDVGGEGVVSSLRYKAIATHGAVVPIGSSDADLSGYATKEYVAKADSQLITELFNTLTVTAEKYVGTGNLNTFWGLLKPSIASLNSSVSDVSSWIDLLELFVTNGEIEGNPFSVTFENLTGVSVTGVWNQASSRIEF